MKLKWNHTDRNYYTLTFKKQLIGEVYLAHSSDNEWQWNIRYEEKGSSGATRNKTEAYRAVEEFASTLVFV